MKSRATICVALVAAGAAVWALSRRAPEAPPPPPPTPPHEAEAEPEDARAVPQAAPSTARELAQELPPATGLSPAQGWRGVVLDEANRPLPAVAVHLLESPSNDPLAVALVAERRLSPAPLATIRTASDGTFALGLPVTQDRVYELFFVAANRAPTRVTGLRLLSDQWFDLGIVVVGTGTVLRGRVEIAGSGAPVPSAMVTVETGTTFVDAALRALPDGERSLSTTVDAHGRYELLVPRVGTVRVTAMAPGFARAVRTGLDLGTQPLPDVDFALPAGLTIRGRVHERNGAGVASARIEAWPEQAALPPLVATSDADGWFNVQNLAPGRYRLRVSARSFVATERLEVEAGRTDLLIAIARRSSLRLRVLAPGGTLVRDYQLAVRRFLADRDGHLAYVPDVPDRRVALRGETERATIDDLPNGTFVFQVAAEGFATTFSEPVDLAAAEGGDGVVRELDVTLSAGATIRGHVMDAFGRPLTGATVTTAAEGADPDSPLWRVLAGAAPERITPRTATTDADGRFELPRLSFGQYQLEVRHPDACLARQNGIVLDAEGVRTIAPIRLVRGAEVSGRVTIGGRTAAQAKILLTTPSNAASRGSAFRLEAIADADGFFRMPRRVPPGMYELRAAALDTTSPEAQPFRQMQQLQRSAVPLSVGDGQERVERDLDIPNDH
ncbi:MAG: carboxypeptidase regulatory-like domain-containing protein [Planctomycetes bacterium]|nr:carboxypeptidase regulatory-like domain-containing protein [Planctomycetota bacterium]